MLVQSVKIIRKGNDLMLQIAALLLQIWWNSPWLKKKKKTCALDSEFTREPLCLYVNTQVEKHLCRLQSKHRVSYVQHTHTSYIHAEKQDWRLKNDMNEDVCYTRGEVNSSWRQCRPLPAPPMSLHHKTLDCQLLCERRAVYYIHYNTHWNTQKRAAQTKQ